MTDLKDFQGDKLAGQKTLPVAIGMVPAKHLIGIGVIIIFATIPAILNVANIIPLLLFLAAIFYISLFLKPYRDWISFLLLLMGFVLISATYIFF